MYKYIERHVLITALPNIMCTKTSGERLFLFSVITKKNTKCNQSN